MFFGLAGGEKVEFVFARWDEGGNRFGTQDARVGGDERCGSRGGCCGGGRKRQGIKANVRVRCRTARGEIFLKPDFEIGHFFQK
jgi:hypothetical protein